jgi:glucokinase
MFVGGDVLEALLIENGHIGLQSLADRTAIVQVHARRRPGRHLANRVLEGKDMAHTFDLLRANDLVFRYVVGEKAKELLIPPATHLDVMYANEGM